MGQSWRTGCRLSESSPGGVPQDRLNPPKRDVTAEGGAVPGEAHETQPGVLTGGRSRRHLGPARPRPQTQEESGCPCGPHVCTVLGQGAPHQ